MPIEFAETETSRDMEDVAHHLQITAHSHSDSGSRDRFGRSAYNRYYYATFLQARAMLSSFNPQWTNLPHATYPELLNGQVQEAFKNARRIAVRVGDSELQKLCAQAISATLKLASIMRLGSATRVVADYEPDTFLEYEAASRFRLKGVSISEAHQWPIESRQLIKTIASAWRQINV